MWHSVDASARDLVESTPLGRRAVLVCDELQVGVDITASCGPGGEEGKERRFTLKSVFPASPRAT